MIQPISQPATSKELSKQPNSLLRKIDKTPAYKTPISSLDPKESEKLSKRLKANFVLSESVTVPLYKLKNDPGLKDLHHSPKPVSFLHERNWIHSNENPPSLDPLKDTLDVLSRILPDNIKKILQSNGIDLVTLSRTAMEIPNFDKGAKSCAKVLTELTSEMNFPTVKNYDLFGRSRVEVDRFAINRRIRKLQRDLENLPQSVDKFDEERSKKKNELEKYHQYNLADDFRKVNNHQLVTALSEIGITSIRVANDSVFINMHDKIGKVLKVSLGVAQVALEVYDKSWKAHAFKINEPKNNELSTSDLMDPAKIRDRRDKLVNFQVSLLMNMMKHIQKPDFEDTSNGRIVAGLLRGLHANPYEISEKMNCGTSPREDLTTNMTKLYKF